MWLILLVIVLCVAIVITRRRFKYNEINYKCFLLTLPNSSIRREKFLKNHNKSIPIEIIYGVDTKDVENAKKFQHIIDPKYFEQAMKIHYNNKNLRPDITYFNLGAIGCYMGHMDFYRRCFEQGLKYAVIFEDNVVISDIELYNEIQKVINTLGDDFEMCFFHCLSRYSNGNVTKDIEKVKWISSTKCYLINVENMEKYYKFYFPMDNHVDMKHEDLIAKGARVFYKDLRHCMYIDRTKSSTIGHSEHYKPNFFSKQYPTATPKVLKYGY